MALTSPAARQRSAARESLSVESELQAAALAALSSLPLDSLCAPSGCSHLMVDTAVREIPSASAYGPRAGTAIFNLTPRSLLAATGRREVIARDISLHRIAADSASVSIALVRRENVQRHPTFIIHLMLPQTISVVIARVDMAREGRAWRAQRLTYFES